MVWFKIDHPSSSFMEHWSEILIAYRWLHAWIGLSFITLRTLVSCLECRLYIGLYVSPLKLITCNTQWRNSGLLWSRFPSKTSFNKVKHSLPVCRMLRNFTEGKYRNFRPFTRTADHPQRSIFVIRGKKFNRLPALPDYPHPKTKENHATVLPG